MSRRPKDISESLFPLLTMYAMMGHGIFRFPAHRQHLLFSAVYAIIVTASYLAALYFTLVFIFSQPWYGDDERIVFFIIYVNVGIAIFGVILSWCNAKRFARIIEQLTKVDETLRQLGATFDYVRMRNEGYGLIFIWIVMVVTFNWVDTLWFNNIMSTGQMYVLATVLHLPVHVNSIIAFNFSVGVSVVGARYKKANMILEILEPPKIRLLQYAGNEITVGTALPISFRRTQIPRTREIRKCHIQIIKHVHLELGNVGKMLSEAYGIQMALEIAALFVMFTGLLYELYHLISNPSAIGRFPRIIVVTVWIGIYLAKLLLVNEACECVCTEARRTGEIIHCLDDNIGDTELSNEISQFSLQLLNNPVVFSPAELITLGHLFVKKFIGTVTTYLMILIQMSPSTSGNVM